MRECVSVVVIAILILHSAYRAPFVKTNSSALYWDIFYICNFLTKISLDNKK